MRFIVNSNLLSKSIQQVARVTPSRSTMPILNNILFVLNDNNLTLRTTDIEITYALNIEVTGEEDGSIAIPVRILQDITTELPDADITLESDGSKINISSTVGNYKINGHQASEFPGLPEIGDASTININADIFKRMIDKTINFVSKDELKPALLGVYFEFTPDFFRAVTTDGHKLIKFTNENVKTNGESLKIVIPPKFLGIVSSLLDKEDTIQLLLGTSHVQIVTENASIYSRLIGENYPDYNAVIPTENDKNIFINTNDLMTSVKRVSIFSNRTTHQIEFNVVPGLLTLSSEDPENNTSAKEEVLVDYDNAEIVIGYNSIYLRDILKIIETDKVHFKLTNAVGAGLVLPETQKDGEVIVLLLMPIRLQR